MMAAITKTLIQNREWIVKTEDKKVGSISKLKKGFHFYKNGNKIFFKDIVSLRKELGIPELEATASKKAKNSNNLENFYIYNYPCKSRPFNEVFNIKKKLPIYTKSAKSKSHFCAGYYVIRFKNSWFKAYCPKLITLDRYPYQGPYKTEEEIKLILNDLNSHEAT
jgi:hypothetical protein